MKKAIEIMDYQGNKRTIDIDMDNVGAINLEVITGDEILTVVYKDYTTERFDSSCDRRMDYYDYDYVVFNEAKGINLLEDDKWLNRKSSYDYDY